MQARTWLLFVIIFAIVSNLNSAQARANPDVRESASPVCHYRTLPRLRGLLFLKSRESSAKAFQREHTFFRELAQTLENCAQYIERHDLQRKFANLRAYVNARANPRPELEASQEATKRYLESLPDFARTPHSLFTSLPRREWRAEIQRLGMPLIENYEDTDTPPRHLTFFAADNYVQFSLFTESFLALITVQAKDEKGKSLAKNKIYFLEYRFPKQDDLENRGIDPQAPASIDTCYSCHPSGLHELVALPGEIALSQWADLNRIDQTIRDLGTEFGLHMAYQRAVRQWLQNR